MGEVGECGHLKYVGAVCVLAGGGEGGYTCVLGDFLYQRIIVKIVFFCVPKINRKCSFFVAT